MSTSSRPKTSIFVIIMLVLIFVFCAVPVIAGLAKKAYNKATGQG